MTVAAKINRGYRDHIFVIGGTTQLHNPCDKIDAMRIDTRSRLQIIIFVVKDRKIS